jgi:hypothetical protein
MINMNKNKIDDHETLQLLINQIKELSEVDVLKNLNEYDAAKRLGTINKLTF